MMTALIGSYVLVCTLLIVSGEGQLPFHQTHGCDRENSSTFIIECDHYVDSKCNSPSLKEIAEIENSPCGYSTKIEIVILPAQLQLNSSIKLSKLEYLTISGNPNRNIRTTITCLKGHFAGLTFENLANLMIRSLTVTGCGTIYPQKESAFISAVIIVHSRNVTAENLIITKSTGIGLLIANHQGGTVQAESSEFHENVLDPLYYNYNNISGGGGLYVGSFENDTSESIMYFLNCTFQNNVANTSFYNFLYIDDLGKSVSGYGAGGGAAIFTEGAINDIHIVFSNCTFKSNEAFKGGGLALDIESINTEKHVIRIKVEVLGSFFEGNGCNNTTVSGGGIHVNFASRSLTNFNTSKDVIIQDVYFNKNCAHFGGGLYFYSDIDRIMDHSNTINVQNCIFDGNSAHTGSAVDITPNVFQRVSTGTRTVPVFRDCRFLNNTIKVNTQKSQTTYGIGTMYVSLYNIKFEGYNSFDDNLGTAIHIVDGNIDMSQSSVYFHKNHGIRGGAIALIGESSIFVGPNRTYTFTNNTALGKGGGLYVQLVDNHDITASKTCFIQYSDRNSYLIPTRKWTASVSFWGNRANAGIGHAIFATSLYPCQTINKGTAENLDLITIPASEVFLERKITTEADLDEDKDYQVATEGATFQCMNVSLKVIPGQKFHHGVTILDDLHNTTRVSLTASIVGNQNVEVDEAFSSCIGEHIVLKGSPREVAHLHLQTTTSRMSYTRLEVELLECPPGFEFCHAEKKCKCNSHEYTGLVKCDPTKFVSYINPGYWAGGKKISNETKLVTSFCPLKFCNYNGTDTTGSEIGLPQKYEMLNEAMCGESRSGTTCGSCARGFTTHFHSPTFACYPVNPALCRVGWLFYILSELVPVTVLFIVVIALNISFTSGMVNGFIFFSQVLGSLFINASGFITFSPALTVLTRGYQLIYGVFNLDMLQLESISFCLWSNASALDMVAVKYVTIVYALFLIVTVLWCMNKCHSIVRCFSKFCRFTTIKKSIIHGVSAFLILCYSQCLQVSLSLLSGYNLEIRDGSELKVSRRVTLNGNIHYFNKQHLPYALLALLCLLTFGAFPPLLLIAYPMFNRLLAFFRLDESKRVNSISRKIPVGSLKPVLDSFQGCFKDNMRYFAGLYFLYQWVPLLIDILISSFSVFCMAVEAFIIVMLLLHAICQPYALKKHNIIDALLLADLALINVITFIHYFKFRTKVGRKMLTELITPTAVIQLMLIYLPLLMAIIYMIGKSCRLNNSHGRLSHEHSKSLSIPLRKLKIFRQEDDKLDGEDLPHRMIAGNTDYECFEDTDRITYVTKETYSGIDSGVTY